MGCSSSSASISHPKQAVHLSKPFITPLTHQQYQERTDTPKASLKISTNYIKGSFAWNSFRGYYPSERLKPNQDSLIISSMFGEAKLSQSFFGVFDGHGRDGHFCSRFVKEFLPKNLLRSINFTTLPLSEEQEEEAIKQILIDTHLKTNAEMHQDGRFDDNLSGTTSISILIRRDKIYVSNVGDSRAIILSLCSDEDNEFINTGSKELSQSLIPTNLDSNKIILDTQPNSDFEDPDRNSTSSSLVARALSSDQTPYRKDERERVKSTGARILTIDQLDGSEPIHENWEDRALKDNIDEQGNPPRVWSPNGNFPGSAFTRSLGDAYAKSCGVIASPEFTIQKLTPKDKFLIIASDGVFEFLTNNMICDLISNNLDPKDACDTIVKSAYDKWIENEIRTDDISIIIIRIDEVSPNGNFVHCREAIDENSKVDDNNSFNIKAPEKIEEEMIESSKDLPEHFPFIKNEEPTEEKLITPDELNHLMVDKQNEHLHIDQIAFETIAT